MVSKSLQTEQNLSAQRLQSVVLTHPYTQADKQASPSAVCRKAAGDKQKDRPEGHPTEATFPAISEALRTLLWTDTLQMKPLK